MGRACNLPFCLVYKINPANQIVDFYKALNYVLIALIILNSTAPFSRTSCHLYDRERVLR